MSIVTDTIGLGVRLATEWPKRVSEPPSNNVIHSLLCTVILKEVDPYNGWFRLKDGEAKEEQKAIIHWHCLWAYLGFPIFSLSEDVALSLLATDFSGLDNCAPTYPYKAFMIRVPKGVLSEQGSDGARFGVTYILHFTCRYAWHEDEDLINIPDFKTVPRDIWDKKLRKAIEDIERSGKNINWTFCAEDGGLMTVDHYRDQDRFLNIKSWRKKISKNVFANEDGGLVRTKEVYENTRARALALKDNLALYLKSDESDARETKYSRLIRPLGSRKKRPVYTARWVVGGSIKLDKKSKGAIKDSLLGSGTSPSIRFMVRGHWRNQACGKGMLDRRLTWVRPHWKGPADESSVLTRLYVAENRERDLG